MILFIPNEWNALFIVKVSHLLNINLQQSQNNFKVEYIVTQEYWTCKKESDEICIDVHLDQTLTSK